MPQSHPWPSSSRCSLKHYEFKLRTSSLPISVEGYRRLARKSVPQMVWAFLEGGSDDLVSLTENRAAFRRYKLRPRVLTGVSKPDLSAVIAGTKVELPIGLAPTGAAGLTHWTGDVAATRAAEVAGTRAILSSACSYTVEEVAEATQQQHWFQLYPIGSRSNIEDLMRRARSAGFTALFVTVDVPVVGNRERERETGMGVPLRLTPARCLNLACHPRWLAGFVAHKRVVPVHYAEWAAKADALETSTRRSARTAARAAQEQARHLQGDLRWEDVAWMRDQWKGRFYVKGIMNPDDAEHAIDTLGAQGVVVSNHGGRQLDNVQGTLDALPAIVERIGDRADVYLDGGVRRGTDVIIALCLGAKAVFIGRPYLYGLAAAGQAGVEAILAIFREELQRDLVLLGCKSSSALDKSWLDGPRA
ncbi:MAG: alpha-hydroxy acid oxidase [Steroidobacteraceae bacterium]